MAAASITRRAAGLAALGAMAAGGARAQAWPTRPIRLIVPFPAGNAGDITARVMGEELSKRLGQPVVVDNRAGGSGSIGIQAVLQAPADGYTLLVTSLSPLSIVPALNANLPYDVERDLVPVALIGWTGMMLVAAPDFPATDLAGVIRELRANPGKHNFANVGPGTLSHLTAELFRISLGLEFEGVTYRGSGQALMDVNAGRVPLMFDGMTSSLAQARGGRVKPIAVSSARRSIFAQDVPALAESGDARLAGFESVGWTGMLAARGTPRPIVDRLNAVVNEALADPALAQRFAAQALEVFPPSTPEHFASYIRADSERWRRVVREAKISVNN
ncbi:tripartite tricarboxylate transporter substrate binding protein [Roseomonas sp. AR75]|uniref:Bug family tripartite tricarboxylate transporter substrate binding protein n=1 Tax=Roseomonas sp. AR75 TaxID=2562311 RepID=UPI001485A707|nr:tripartite tricarboxylate transporter substrate binding protein [Roseomonas sp. AR75]